MMSDLNPGECMYFPNEIIPENIRLLIKSGKLKKVSNKVYYKVGNGLLGEIPFNEDYYDDNVLIGVDHSNGYLTSYSFFNRMGFTTQVPVKRFIVSNVDSDIELVWTKVLKPKVKITKENWRILQFLDFIEEINYIACFRADCAFNYLLRFLNGYKILIIG